MRDVELLTDVGTVVLNSPTTNEQFVGDLFTGFVSAKSFNDMRLENGLARRNERCTTNVKGLSTRGAKQPWDQRESPYGQECKMPVRI